METINNKLEGNLPRMDRHAFVGIVGKWIINHRITEIKLKTRLIRQFAPLTVWSQKPKKQKYNCNLLLQ